MVGGERQSWVIETRAVKEFEVVCELCILAAVDASESQADVYVELVGSCCRE